MSYQNAENQHQNKSPKLFFLYEITDCEVSDPEHVCSHKQRCRLPKAERANVSKEKDVKDSASSESLSSCSEDEEDESASSSEEEMLHGRSMDQSLTLTEKSEDDESSH